MSDQKNLQNAEARIKEVAERIARLREDLGISVEEMAAKTDYSVEDYKLYESGEKDLYENVRDLLVYNKRRSAEREVQREKKQRAAAQER